MKLIHEITGMEYPIKLFMTTRGEFRVDYGKQVTRGLTYDEAARNYGEAILHAVTLEGLTDTEGGQ